MAGRARKVRLDRLLVDRTLAPDPRTAAAWVMARRVKVGDDFVTKPGTPIAVDAEVTVAGLDRRYVGRGGEKLVAALGRFRPDIEGRVALDAGASTGGFSDCLLQHGAARVYSVDVGFGQLRGSLAADPRVVALERTNIGDLRQEHLDPPIDFCVADLSYLSIARSLPILTSLFVGPPVVIHLVKPLFEGVDEGSAADPTALAAMLPELVRVADACEVGLRNLMASPILGSGGTVEFFALFGMRKERHPEPERLFESALGEAMSVMC